MEGSVWLIVLPVVFFLLAMLAVIGRSWIWSGRTGWSEAFVLALTLLTLWALAGAEGCSVFRRLAVGEMVAWWGLGVLLLAWPAFRLLKQRLPRPGIGGWWREARFDEKLVAGLVALLLLGAFLMAVMSPPNNGDSMIYHLPRQLFWMSHGTVYLESAPNGHMVKMPPLTEYIGVNLFLLTDTDRFHNLIQWTAMFGVLVVIGMILRDAGAGRRAMVYAGAFAVTYPAAFYQASNTKNDLVTAFFLLAAIWVLGRFVIVRRMTAAGGWWLGGFAGCSLLAKGTAVAFLPPIGLAFGILMLRRRTRWSLGAVVLGGIVLAAVAGPHYTAQYRKIAVTELGEDSHHTNADPGVIGGTSVLVRNVALEFATPWPTVNRAVERATTALMGGLGRVIDDPSTTFPGHHFALAYLPREEDRASGLFQFLSLIGLAPGVYWFWRRDSSGVITASVLAALGMLICFSVLFRWQIWHMRLLVPCAAVAAIPFGFAVSRVTRNGLRLLIITPFFLWITPAAVADHRPLFGQRSLFRLSASERRVDPMMRKAVNEVARISREVKPKSVVFDTAGGFAYPMMWAIRREVGDEVEFLSESEAADRDVDAWLTCVTEDRGLDEVREAPERRGMSALYIGDEWSFWLDSNTIDGVKPAFSDFFWGGAVEGMGPVQGPYPQLRAPAFRNAYYPLTRLTAPPSEDPRRLRLAVQAFRGRNVCEVWQDDRRIGTLTIDGSHPSAEFETRIAPSANPVRIELRFARGVESAYDSEPVALRVTRLQLLPAEESRPDAIGQ